MVVGSEAKELARASIELREVCLHESSFWAAEQLKGLPLHEEEVNMAKTEGIKQALQASDLSPEFHLARQFFEEKEYKRAAHFLKDVPGEKPCFLRSYALFLAGQKNREEEAGEHYSGPMDLSQIENAHLDNLEENIQNQLQHYPHSPFLLYVYGLVLSDRQEKDEARQVLAHSLRSYPCNWSAWLALRPMCTSMDIFHALDSPNHWMMVFFQSDLSIELQSTQEGLKRLQEISMGFPTSAFVIFKCACAHYNLRNFPIAQSLFEDLFKADPYRLQGMDIYSNILYVKEMSAELSYLAHRAMSTEKYCPETCCIVGNYYSLKTLHNKAILYFQRALKLDSKFLSAWTLMGHEYVEVRNYAAAIDAYRHAVDLNPNDYRPWYGLGQAYEMMQMPSFALHYFRRASNIQPDDARMWNAMGICYQAESINKADAAINCFERSLSLGDEEGVSVNFLARLYQASNKAEHAVHYFELSLKRLDDQHTEGKDVVEALDFLAEYYMGQGKFRQAEQYCVRLMDLGGPEREKAKQMLREMKDVRGRWIDIDPIRMFRA